MRAYSQDLRERVVRACDERRGTRQQIADLFGVSTAWVRRLLQRRRQTGSFAAKPHAGGAVKMTPDRRDRLVVLVSEQPDATLAELHDRLAAPVHPSTIARALLRLGLTVKKKSAAPPSRTGRTCGTSGPSSGAGRPALTRAASCSSTRPA
jgi:transposase